MSLSDAAKKLVAEEAKSLQKAASYIPKFEIKKTYNNRDFSKDPLPPGFSIRVSSGQVSDYLFVRCHGEMTGTVDQINRFFELDESIQLLKPKYLTKWKTLWRNHDDGSFVRHAQISGFLGGATVDCYGLAIPVAEEKSVTWYCCVLDARQIKLFGNDILKLDKKKQNELTVKKWIQLDVPLIEFKVCDLGSGKLKYSLTNMCNLKGVPKMLYTDMVAFSMFDAMIRLSKIHIQ